ncbi:hypothetical protein B0293_01000 [Amycolatopsis azurea DSM 43854]|uniref:Uncharacterized protein n=1 Tax=Amycolatopsis azurea DSM 43854 TaxID=1238180 RepID=A0ABX3JNN1_9PSEU|nr:hypothetical protein B0293_01000 [Amycolatopsis azurea DSM 43854]
MVRALTRRHHYSNDTLFTVTAMLTERATDPKFHRRFTELRLQERLASCSYAVLFSSALPGAERNLCEYRRHGAASG